MTSIIGIIDDGLTNKVHDFIIINGKIKYLDHEYDISNYCTIKWCETCDTETDWGFGKGTLHPQIMVERCYLYFDIVLNSICMYCVEFNPMECKHCHSNQTFDFPPLFDN